MRRLERRNLRGAHVQIDLMQTYGHQSMDLHIDSKTNLVSGLLEHPFKCTIREMM